MKLACFTVLHYKTTKETIKCIDSLMILSGIDKCQIIVYDNGSQNGSFEQLQKKFKLISNVGIYKSDENRGFSAGNNEAFKIAKSFNPKYIIVLNNDIEIRQRDFLTTLEKINIHNEYYVIGPDVYAPFSQGHQNPLYKTFPQKKQLDVEMKYYKNILNDLETSIALERKKRTLNNIRKIFPQKLMLLYRKVKIKLGIVDSEKFEKHMNACINPVLQGSCLIFTEPYIKNQNILFEPDTKFYFEELLLALKCRTLNYKTLYTPQLQVVHNHGVSTRTSVNSIRDYLVFYAKSMLDAYQIFTDALEDNPWKKNH